VVALGVSLLLGYFSLTPNQEEWMDDLNQKDKYAIVIPTTCGLGEGGDPVSSLATEMRLTVDRQSGGQKQTYSNALEQGLD
jgi:hypothetical protein